LTRSGDYSYGLYLYAFPIQQALVAAGVPGGALGNFALAALLASGCAILSWHLIERPALRAKPAATSGRRAGAALEAARAG
jgi:peptidoglycan/LPS O-acetylase OafA/YrhL